MIKHIFSDLDGTLSCDSLNVSMANVRAVAEAIDKGIGFSIATGRVYPAARIFHDRLNLVSPLVCLNGALVMDVANDKPLLDKPLDIDKLKEMVKILKREDRYFHVYSRDEIYGERFEHILAHYYEKGKTLPKEHIVKVNHISDFDEILESGIPIYKLGIIYDDDKSTKRVIEELASVGVDTFKSSFTIQDFMTTGVNKATAIQSVIENNNIMRDEIICIGDNENDVDMIKFAGLGIAMGSSDESLKLAADIILDGDDEEAISYVIKAYAINTCTL